MVSKTDLLQSILKELVANIDESKAAVIADKDGLVISSVLSEGEDEQVIGSLAAVFDGFFKRVKNQTGSDEKFVNITISGDQKIGLISESESEATLAIVCGIKVKDNQIKVIGKHVMQKIDAVFDGTLTVNPKVSGLVKLLADFREGVPKSDFAFKLIVCGDHMVGKTSLIKKFVENSFSEDYVPSIGVNIYKKSIVIEERAKIHFIIWDIAGQIQSMASFRKKFYAGADCAFIVVDLSNRSTFNSIDDWIEDIRQSTTKKIPTIIIGNKNDINYKEISFEELDNKAKEKGFLSIDTSAKVGTNVLDAFEYIGYKILSERF